MPGLDLTQLGSNWKLLKAKLQADKGPSQRNGLKRHRDDVLAGSSNGVKKRKLPQKDRKPRPSTHTGDMGTTTSQESARLSSLQTNHDISKSDLAAAYGTPPSTLRTYTDTINGGLHPAHKIGHYVALDCEMVGTGPPPHTDNLLARVSIVNFHGEQIYDSYVLPPPGVKVEDYRTFVSGIRPAHLHPTSARPFADVQRDVSAILTDRILVGHALRNDLTVLLLSHPKRDVRDTSRYGKFREKSMGKTPALRNLAREQLGVEVQRGEHSSLEDARVTMALFRMEKVGFEEEARRRFGNHARVAGGRAKGRVVASARSGEEDRDDSDGEDEEEDDLEFLDGEEEDDIPARKETLSATVAAVKRKNKKKKRTKRK